MSRIAILLTLMLLIVGMIVGLRQPGSPPASSVTGTALVIDGYREAGELHWTVSTQKATLEDDVGTLEFVILTIYPDDGDPIQVTADRLVRGVRSSTLTGAPRMTRGEQFALETESLYWDETHGVLESASATLWIRDVVVQAGALHHDLHRGDTRLVRGVRAEAHLDGTEYVATADSAHHASDCLTLQGGVLVASESGDTYRADRLISCSSSSTLELHGNVTGQWDARRFSADALRIDGAGIRLQGHVTLDLSPEDGPHDT